MPEAEKADCGHRVEQQNSLSIDLQSRCRFIRGKGTFQYWLLALLKNHAGEILVPIAEHGSLVVDDTNQAQSVRINDDVVNAEVGVYQHWMVISDGSSLLERQIDASEQFRILDELG